MRPGPVFVRFILILLSGVNVDVSVLCEGGGEEWCEIVFVRERECVNKKKKNKIYVYM